MKTVWLQRDDRPQALVFFAGWGMDIQPFQRLTSSAYDVCVCYDYRVSQPQPHGNAHPDSMLPADTAKETLTTLGAYRDITVVAWSFGCAIANQIMARSHWPLRDAVAINGTVTPEDEHMGIPKRWLDATAANLHEDGWTKFVRRMCLGKAARQDFFDHSPKRDLASIVEELDDLRQLATPRECHFRRALIGSKDRIILPENQQRCWEHFGIPFQTIAASHYPFHVWNSWDELLATEPQ